jgi:hypothetical protein
MQLNNWTAARTESSRKNEAPISASASERQPQPRAMLPAAKKKATPTHTAPSKAVPTATRDVDKNSNGLQILYEADTKISSPNTQVVQIIFVHGLGGSAKETWTDSKTNGFWLTWLHEQSEFENVRIATFAYDAKFDSLTSGNHLAIPDFADQLLDDLVLDCFRQKKEVCKNKGIALIVDTYNFRCA